MRRGAVRRGGWSRVRRPPAPGGRRSGLGRDERRVRVVASDLRKARGEPDDLPERVRPVPRGRESRAATAAEPAESAMSRLVTDPNVLLDQRKDLVGEEVGIAAVERVVLGVAGDRVDEDADHRRDVARCDQVVQDDPGPQVVLGVEETAAIQEEDAGQHAVPCCGGVHPDVAAGARERSRVGELQPGRPTRGDTGLRHGVRSVVVEHVGLVDRQRLERDPSIHAREPSLLGGQRP